MTTSVKTLKQDGFTLIEVMLVLAISGLLLLITFFGQGSVRTQSQFRDSVEEFRASLEKIKDDVNNGIAPKDESGCGTSQAAGSNANCVQFGTVVAFERDTSNYFTFDIVGLGPGAAIPDASLPVQSPTPLEDTVTQRSLLWGSEFNFDVEGVQKAIAFTRHTGTGKLQTHVYSDQDLSSITGPDASSDEEIAEVINSTAGVKYTFTIIGTDCDAADIIINDPVNTIRIEHKDKVLC